MHYYFITGATSGLGKETARLLLKPGNHVVSISRTAVPELSRRAEEEGSAFTHIQQDLTKVNELQRCVESLWDVVERGDAEPGSVCLIQNAANAAPFKPLELVTPEEIIESFNLNLLAPALLSSLWMQSVGPLRVPKKLVLVSSGSAEHPMAGMSLYCSAKAGLTMLARCIQLEQSGVSFGVQVAAVDPGMMDTPMQMSARAADEAEFPAGAFFRRSMENGLLRTPESAARSLVEWIADSSQWTKDRLGAMHRL